MRQGHASQVPTVCHVETSTVWVPVLASTSPKRTEISRSSTEDVSLGTFAYIALVLLMLLMICKAQSWGYTFPGPAVMP